MDALLQRFDLFFAEESAPGTSRATHGVLVAGLMQECPALFGNLQAYAITTHNHNHQNHNHPQLDLSTLGAFVRVLCSTVQDGAGGEAGALERQQQQQPGQWNPSSSE